MNNKKVVFPLEAARTLALHSQSLMIEPSQSPSSETIYNVVKQLGCVQIDSLQVVQRSQYLVIWSRLGCYNPTNFDVLLFGSPQTTSDKNHRRCFEYWMHAASIIPLTEYRYHLPKMRQRLRKQQEWAQQPENKKLVRYVLARIRDEGPLRTADFKSDYQRRSSWWDWKPAKRALEYLYNCGELMISNRINFQRVYDLRERVLPDWVDTKEPTLDEAILHTLESSARALGICQPAQIADYTHMKRIQAKPFIKSLLEQRNLIPIKVRVKGGNSLDFVIHKDNFIKFKLAADGKLKCKKTFFLSPFDSLFWAKERDMQLWGFRQVLEAYKPASSRKWGYFCLPILHNGQLVGRFDPKLERTTQIMRLKTIYLEPGILPKDELVAAIAKEMRSFMEFHQARHLIIENSKPMELSVKILKFYK